jgi:hypothetical protein
MEREEHASGQTDVEESFCIDQENFLSGKSSLSAIHLSAT